MKTTFVIPCHNEEANIAAVYAALAEVAQALPMESEFLFIDDGSTDTTLEKIRELRQRDPRVCHASFLRNYGHQNALMAGLQRCDGDFAVSLDADLQHPPAAIPRFFEAWQQSQPDIVSGRRLRPQQGLIKELCSRTFYRCFSLATGMQLEPGVSDFRLYTRKSLKVLCSLREREPFIRGMIAHLGLRTVYVDYPLHGRHAGLPAYTFRKSARMAFYGLLRYSDLPTRFGLSVGLLGIVISLGVALHYLYLRLFTDALIPGQADLMVFLGLICSVMAILLSLQTKVLLQVQSLIQRDPQYLVAEESKPVIPITPDSAS